MTRTRALLAAFSFSFILHPVTASAPAQDWHHVEVTLRSTLDVLQLSHDQHLAREAVRLSKRDLTFRTGRAGHWKPMAISKRLDPADDVSGQMHTLITEIGTNIEEFLELIASQVNAGTFPSGVVPSWMATPTVATGPNVLPITNLNTPSASTTSHTTMTTTSRPLAADQPLTTSMLHPPSQTYTFNAQATDLNVVYYSQTDQTPFVSLTQICNDPAIDMVIMAFVTSLEAGGGYPSMNMASNCWAPNGAQAAVGATGLLDCVGDGLSAKVAQCQAKGKKVLMSLGGSAGDLTLISDDQAVQAANMLWDLFLGGTNATVTPLRPFGNVVLDGIDFDNETPTGATYLPTIARTLRQTMSTANKPYYLTAAPECPGTNGLTPVSSLIPDIDFLSVQFYNNPICNLDGPGFLTSLQTWSSDLTALTNLVSGSRVIPPRSKRALLPPTTTGFQSIANGITSPRLLIGAPAFRFPHPASSPDIGGYVNVSTFKAIMEVVKGLALPNLAGVTYWDGAYQEESGQVVDGVNTTFAQVVREVFG